MSSEDEFGAVCYLAPRSPDSHKVLARQFSINDSGIVDLHGSRSSSRIGLAIPNNCYGDWDQHSDPRTPTSTHAFFQRTNSHPLPASPPWSNQMPVFAQAPDKYRKVPDYEELPNSSRHPDDLGVYTPIDEGSMIVTTQKKSQNATNPNGKQAEIKISTNSRLRTNPLYDQSGGSFILPRYPPPKTGVCAGGSCCLQTFGILFALMALAVVLVSFLAGRSGGQEYHELVKDIEGLRSNLSNLYQMVQNNDDAISSSRIIDFNSIVQLLHNKSQMQETLSDLEAKVQSIRMQASLQEASIQNLTNQIASQTDQITFLKSQESQANETFQNLKLSIGEKKQLEMRGLANMSACIHNRKSVGRASSYTDTLTDPLDLSHVLVLGVLCTTTGGTEAMLEDEPSTPNIYRCICRGRKGEASNRHCIIHYWTCPLLP